MKLISQGAEAKIFLIDGKINKQRIPKSYRHPQLDNQIRTRRTKSESKILTKSLEAGVNVPRVLSTDKFNLEIEFINGDRLSETLNSYPEKKQFQIMQQLGKQVALLHANNIIHGDLTTSNTILAAPENMRGKASPNSPSASAPQSATKNSPSPKPTTNDQRPTTDKPEIFLIDFGLSYVSTKTEDKAVDIHLIKQALEAKHFKNHEKLFQQFLKTYKNKTIIERLKTVEKRGRYKNQ